MKKIAILECYDDRGRLLKETLLRVESNLQIDLFKTYENSFPDITYDAFIISGGILTVDQKNKYPHLIKIERFIQKIAEKNVPILGICLGHQLIADTYNGEIKEAKELEVGFTKIYINKKEKLFDGLANDFYAFNYHWDYVSKVPKEFIVLAKSNMCEVHIIKHKDRPIFGFQFHIEYDEKTSIPVLDYLKEEIIGEDINYDGILEANKFYEKTKISILLKNFLKYY